MIKNIFFYRKLQKKSRKLRIRKYNLFFEEETIKIKRGREGKKREKNRQIMRERVNGDTIKPQHILKLVDKGRREQENMRYRKGQRYNLKKSNPLKCKFQRIIFDIE